MDLSIQIEFGDGHKHTFRLDTGAECKILLLKTFYKVTDKVTDKESDSNEAMHHISKIVPPPDGAIECLEAEQ